jgi:phytoene/squalene synthetase
MYSAVKKASFKISSMYPLAARKLPQDLYVKVFTLYEMLRVADIIEDNNPKNKKDLLQLHSQSLFNNRFSDDINDFITETALDKQEEATSDYYRMFFSIFSRLPDPTKEIIASTNNAMIPGMTDNSYNDIKTWAQQNEYAGYVAGEVGVGLTKLFAEHIPLHDLDSMLKRGYAQGIALQKVNILRDLRRDIANDRNYIPEELLIHHGLNKKDLFKTHKIDTDDLFLNPESEKLKRQYAVIKDMAVDAQKYLITGLDYVLNIPSLTRRSRYYNYSEGIRLFTASLLLVAQEMSYNIYTDPTLTEHSYKPRSLIIKYGLKMPLIWDNDEKIKGAFLKNKIL